MRKLKTADIPAFCRCLKRIGARDMIKTLAQQADSAKDVWALGFDALWDLFDLATEKGGETAIYEFLAGPFEMTAKQVADLELEALMSNIKQLAEENNLAGFFKSATALMR